MRPPDPMDSWPNDWAGNLRLDSGPESGAPMLLFGGLGVSAFLLRPAAEACGELPLRVRLQSLPGHTGDSAAFEEMTFEQTIAEAGDALCSMAQETGQTVLLGGFSGGAVLAMCLAARWPKLVRSLHLIGYCPRLRGVKRSLVVGACGFLDRFRLTRGVLLKRSFKVKESGVSGVMHPAYFRQPRFSRYSAKSLAVLSALQRAAADAVWTVKVPVHFFHGTMDDRADPRLIRDLAGFFSLRGSPEKPWFYESPHCVLLGPEREQFMADFAAQARKLI